MRRVARVLAALGMAAAGGALAGEPPAPPLWVAVGPPGLVEAVEPLAARRKAEGFEVVVSAKPVAEALAAVPDFEVLPALLRGNKPFQLKRAAFLLLVGDDEPGKEAEPWSLPAKRRALYRWRDAQATEYAADPLWGDLDGDGIPEIPVGRLPARTRAEADLAVKKILAYEAAPVAAADLRLAVWAGSPRYGGAVDATAALTLLTSIQAGVPGWLQPWVLASDPRFPFCGWPPAQPGRFARELRQGAILAAMMGHADAERFWAMAYEGKDVAFSAADAAAAFGEGPPVAPLVVMACSAGDFARPAPGLAEALLALPGGPVAVVAATTDTHPLTNYFTGMALLEAIGGKDRRLGTVWLRAQRAAYKARNPLAETVLRNVEGKLEAELDIPKLKRDQLLMYALLGDPATLLRYPLPMEVTTQKTIEGWKWKAVRPEGAETLQVGLRPVSPRPPIAKGVSDEATAQAQLEEGNGALAYVVLPAPAAGDPWEGVTPKGGWLRLVATGGGKTWVACVKLE
jgi:hypothetical protein